MSEKLNNNTEQDSNNRDAEAEYPPFDPEATQRKRVEYQSYRQTTINPLAFNSLQARRVDRATIAKQFAEQRSAREEELRREEEETKLRREKAKQEAQEREQELLRTDMSQARSHFERAKNERFKNQRTQEIVEKDLNSRLLSIDDLEIGVLSGDSGISKRTILYEDDEITIYDLKGLPYTMLTTTIDYRRANKEALDRGEKIPDNIGIETYQELMNNPAIWVERQDQAENVTGFGTRAANARGDVMSCSFHNSDTNNKGFVDDSPNSPHDLIYGFENVKADSIISIHNQDGGTSNTSGKSDTLLDESKLDIVGAIQGGNRVAYNEVLLRRYSENGIPKRPDYIVVTNGRISDAALRHAKFFDIPIVNIEESIYDEKQKNRGKALIESIDENDEYLDCYKKIAEIRSMDYYQGAISLPKNTRDISASSEDYKRIATIEFSKRIDYLKKTIEEITEKLEFNLENENTSLPETPEEFNPNSFQVSLYDASRQETNSDGLVSKHSNQGPNSSISVSFVPKKEFMKVETILSEDQDGEFYHALESTIRKYLETLQKYRSTQKNNKAS